MFRDEAYGFIMVHRYEYLGCFQMKEVAPYLMRLSLLTRGEFWRLRGRLRRCSGKLQGGCSGVGLVYMGFTSYLPSLLSFLFRFRYLMHNVRLVHQSQQEWSSLDRVNLQNLNGKKEKGELVQKCPDTVTCIPNAIWRPPKRIGKTINSTLRINSTDGVTPLDDRNVALPLAAVS